MYRLILLMALLIILNACTSIRTTESGGKHYRYFGFVEVVVPKTEQDIEAYRIQAMGIAIENGLSIGWRETEMVLVPLKEGAGAGAPQEATCSMVVIVRSDTEAKHAREILSELKGANICLTSFQ